ncbi:MAG: FtsW/RodA/SpoVE family cell cycle protein [Firmicutes bacterium]|nr:FtsW/RodA/SpoVE family cell cycle protein [Bacillota bacterium]
MQKIKKLFKNIDKPLFFVMLIIIIFGLLNIVTASSRETVVRYEQSLYHYFFQHLIMLSIAFIGSLVIIKTPTKSYKLLGPFLYIVVLCLLLYLSVVGIAERGSINWLSIGGFTFQPSELAKPVMIVTLALLFEKFYKKIRMPNTNHYDMIGFILGAGLIMPVIVFLQGDLGTSLIILGIFFVMFISSPILKIDKFKTIIFLFIVGVIGIIGVYSIKGHILTEAQTERFDFFNPCSKYEDSGYQICNGFIAINDGGLLGLGIGKSKQKYSYIPDPHTDSVFAIIAEELGFLLSTLIFIAYIFILGRILRIATNASTVRGRYMCLGISVYMFLHILLNLGGLFGILPLTGVPLPFLSYGGTFTICLVCSLAIVQRVHIETYSQKSIKH